jgi:hypothetical protein
MHTKSFDSTVAIQFCLTAIAEYETAKRDIAHQQIYSNYSIKQIP